MKSIFVLGLLAAALLISAASAAEAQTTSAAQQPAATSQNSGNTAPQNSINTPAYNAPPAWQNGTPSEVATTINPRTGAGAGEPNGIVRLYGCLERGSGADEYSLMGRGADWWELKSTSIDLGAYLDQTVMIAALPNPDGTLNVTALAMVQNSCTY